MLQGQSQVGPVLDLPPSIQPLQPVAMGQEPTDGFNPAEKEWWERTGSFPASVLQNGNVSNSDNRQSFNGNASGIFPLEDLASAGNSDAPQPELPTWLTDQPTSSGMPALGPITPLSPSIAASSLPTMAMGPVTPLLTET